MTPEVDLDPARSATANLLAIAPPGCGKTELLARRAVYLVGQLQSHQQILALTFSNRATRNLRERLLGALGPQRFRRHVRVTNFHGHAAEIIRAHGRTIGLDPDSPMPGRSTLSTAISGYTDGMPVGLAIERKGAIEAALSEAKRGAHDDDQVRDALALSGNAFAQEIEAERREQGILHFDDLLRHAQRLLSVEAVARLYQLHYGAVLVDEFQDLSSQQLAIALASSSTSRTFVGDPLQGIYSWAGARPAEVEKELRDLCGEPQRLAVSYRSSPAVLGVVNRVAAMLDGEPLHAAHPEAWPQGGAAASSVFGTGLEEAQWIVDVATKILASNPEATIGVITRAGWRRGPIDAAFATAAHLPQQRWDLAIEDSELVQRLVAAVDQLPRRADMQAVKQAVLEDIDPGDVEVLEKATDALAEFEGLVAQAGTLAAAAAQLRVVNSEGAIEPGVHLLNAHTGKGQQFDWVFVPGLEDFHIPGNRATTREQLREELRVVLVMLSRARHGIIVTRACSLISRAGNSYSTTTSCWWPEVAGACSLGADDLVLHLASLPGAQSLAADH
ncbi:ATP-dependent DNA helicase PcrA [Streptomyces sp. ADI92-24]|uniref:UvrD-helicase domain-containing protein n=1 Tax=Streptomyces sp. ADI92-24 TaxID=1522756 RepID=UPI000F54E626|nr:ATP-dependent helicase [Streptomyces sp. ADI92-24]RPK41743.1 ATP-dependent DNA helicase PcrA [Streptomyces sp. ADI92-24]